MANIFDSVKLSKPKSSNFDLSHDVKMSFNFGELVPTMCLECIPGDRFTIGCDSLLRFAPLVSPVMHRADVTMHYFFIPNRLIWPNWDKFITNDASTPAMPRLTINAATYTPLMDYLGLPTPFPLPAPSESVSALPFAAYQMVYNEFYRDQNLQTEVPFALIDGNNDANVAELSQLRLRAWEHDYFTAALPWAQKGGNVEIPLGGFGDVPVYRNTPTIVAGTTITAATGPTPLDLQHFQSDNVAIPADDLYAELSSATMDNTSIQDLRRAFRLQEWLEKAARGGSRYVENILSFFGVKSPDSRLNRPEYITGTKSPVVISEVLNTTGTIERPQGDMAGHGVSVTQGKYGSYFCQEHGYIIGIMSCMPKPAYQQGIPKHFLKGDMFDYYWPQFANIGEQAILNRELYAYDPLGGDTFGYIPRYAEYKYIPNRVSGEFRTSLDFWHMGRIFGSPPNLNASFIQMDEAEVSRIFAVTDPDVDKLWCHILHKIRARRPMPKYGTPSF